jgi:hypothetical protein
MFKKETGGAVPIVMGCIRLKTNIRVCAAAVDVAVYSGCTAYVASEYPVALTRLPGVASCASLSAVQSHVGSPRASPATQRILLDARARPSRASRTALKHVARAATRCKRAGVAALYAGRTLLQCPLRCVALRCCCNATQASPAPAAPVGPQPDPAVSAQARTQPGALRRAPR